MAMAGSTTSLLQATLKRSLKNLSISSLHSYCRAFPVRSLCGTAKLAASRIPPPTWSIDDLFPLSSSQSSHVHSSQSISDEELDILASRSLLHIPESERATMKKELSKIHNFISLVQQAKFDNEALTEEDMYDAPRGFGMEGMKVRHEDEELDAWKDKVEQDAKRIMDHLKGIGIDSDDAEDTDTQIRKMVPRHDEKDGRTSYYFSIVTTDDKE